MLHNDTRHNNTKCNTQHNPLAQSKPFTNKKVFLLVSVFASRHHNTLCNDTRHNNTKCDTQHNPLAQSKPFTNNFFAKLLYLPAGTTIRCVMTLGTSIQNVTFSITRQLSQKPLQIIFFANLSYLPAGTTICCIMTLGTTIQSVTLSTTRQLSQNPLQIKKFFLLVSIFASRHHNTLCNDTQHNNTKCDTQHNPLAQSKESNIFQQKVWSLLKCFFDSPNSNPGMKRSFRKGFF